MTFVFSQQPNLALSVNPQMIAT